MSSLCSGVPQIVISEIGSEPRPGSARPATAAEPDFNTGRVPVRDREPACPKPKFLRIVPARRRGSICERWGSESERAKPRGAERRGSIGMEQMVRDLVYGVQHRELMAANGGGPGITDSSGTT
nr:hypothetical protein BaRGS_015893 [Batillaria attramentaria]